MSIWGNLNGTVFVEGLGVTFHKILGFGLELFGCLQPARHCPAQPIIRLSQLSKDWKKRPAFLFKGKSHEVGLRMKPASFQGPFTC